MLRKVDTAARERATFLAMKETKMADFACKRHSAREIPASGDERSKSDVGILARKERRNLRARKEGRAENFGLGRRDNSRNAARK